MTLITGVGFGLAAAFGAVIGSFLSVVAARLPALILDENRRPLRDYITVLSWPPSHCRCCESPLRWRDNIPVLSYLLLKGRCRGCGVSYGAKYLALECAGAAAAVASVAAFGWTGHGFFCFLLLAALLVLSAIDLKEQLLPDVLVAPLLPLGVLFQIRFGEGLSASLLGMAAAYLVMWAIAAVYRIGRGVEGLGRGDVKLAAGLGAWLGIAAIPYFLTAAFACGLAVSVLALALGRLDHKAAVPFGPFLAVSAAGFVLFPAALPWLQAALYGA